MKFPWRSHKPANAGGAGVAPGAYLSEETVESRSYPGVRFRIARMSFSRRVELMREIRNLARRVEFLGAGVEPEEKMEAALLQAEIEQLYVAWGVKAVEGLTVDGVSAGPELLAAGPEELFREAVAAVKHEIGLTAEERKNS